MTSFHHLTKNSGPVIDNVSQYKSIIRALQYITPARQEIAFIVNKLSQFLSNPFDEHYQAYKRILRNLKGTIHFGLEYYQLGDVEINYFTDPNWACDRDDKTSVAGYAMFLGLNLVSWSSKKQHVVSRSSSESEYRALASATTEVLWIQALLSKLHVKISKMHVILCDNQGAIALTNNLVYHAKTKHIELNITFVKEKVSAKQLSIRFVPSDDQTANILTKALTYGQFHYLRCKLNVLPWSFILNRDVRICCDDGNSEHD